MHVIQFQMSSKWEQRMLDTLQKASDLGQSEETVDSDGDSGDGKRGPGKRKKKKAVKSGAKKLNPTNATKAAQLNFSHKINIFARALHGQMASDEGMSIF